MSLSSEALFVIYHYVSTTETTRKEASHDLRLSLIAPWKVFFFTQLINVKKDLYNNSHYIVNHEQAHLMMCAYSSNFSHFRHIKIIKYFYFLANICRLYLNI